MELLKALLLSFPLSLITVAVEYRFICKTLERKTSGILTFGIMLIVYIAANGLNMWYLFAKSVGINTLYYCILRQTSAPARQRSAAPVCCLKSTMVSVWAAVALPI